VTTYDPIERVRRARRQAATMAALVALAALLVSIVAVRLWTGRGAADPGAAPSSPVANDGGPDLRWRTFRPGQDLPESLTAGPTRHVDGRVAGFTRSQLGAALATVHIAHRIDPTAGPSVFEPTIREQVVGVDAQRLAEQTSAAYEEGRRAQGKGLAEALDPGPAHLIAYKVETYSPDAANVSMITSENGTQFFSFRFDVRWTDDDWHLVAPTGGNLSTVLTRLEALPVGAITLARGT
jgi:hypothetical protein